MQEDKEKTEELIDVGEANEKATEIDLDKKLKEEKSKRKKLLKTVISPLTHLRNCMSQWMFEIARTTKNKLQRKK